MSSQRLKIYTTTSCGDCRQVLVEPSRRELLESLGIDHLPHAS